MDREAKKIISYLPGLAHDEHFCITSPATRDYNCLAWALSSKNMWMWPDENPDEDDYCWPDGVAYNTRQETFIEAYKNEGFELSDSAELEEGYEKIALYGYWGFAFHASRQLPTGLWTSKLGPGQDIQHGTPQSIEGNHFGHVFCYMKRKIAKSQ